MFLESFNEVENFTITKLPLRGSKRKITEEMKPLLIISDLDNSDESTSGIDTDTKE